MPWDKGTVLLFHFPTEIIARKPGLIVGRVGRKNRPLVPEDQSDGEETGACRDYDDFFNRTKYTVPEGVLDENGRMEAFNNDLVIRYLDRVVVKDDGYEVIFKAGVTVEVEI